MDGRRDGRTTLCLSPPIVGSSDVIKVSAISVNTRLPFNLRPTTRECVHLVRRGHFRSRDKDGGHTTRSAMAANCMALCFIEPELLPMEVLHCGNRTLDLFAPVTLTLTR